MTIKLIPSLPGYIINNLGQVFKSSVKKDVLITNVIIGNKLNCQISGKTYEVLYLLIEAFQINITPNDRLKFRINRRNLTLSVDSIKIIPVKHISFYKSKEEKVLQEYGCPQKASNANTRFVDKISGVEIFNRLKMQEFHCHYCGEQLDPQTWQIDHFYSKNGGGRNVFANIVACCGVCNRMKHTLDGHAFLKRCGKIFKLSQKRSSENQALEG